MMIMVRLEQWSNDGGMTNKGGYNVGIIDGQDRAAMLITIAVKMDVINILREGVKKSFFWDFVPNIGPHPTTANVWDSIK